MNLTLYIIIVLILLIFVTANGEEYSIRWKKWISDIIEWRNYNPQTIKSIGILIGYDPSVGLIGKEMLSGKKEILRKQDQNGGHYAWVLTKSYDIIYVWNSGASVKKRTHIRHSQLGSGKPVLCAGEFTMSNDQIATINDHSGHYRPKGKICLKKAVNKLKEIGVNTDIIKISTAEPFY